VITLQGFALRADAFALGPLDIELKPGEYFVLLGPSGAGKTLLLEAVAGLRPAAEGRVLYDGEDATPLPPERRGVGFVYQDYLLFPHLSTAANIAFGLGPATVTAWARGGAWKLRRRALVDSRVREVARLLGIEALLARRPATLSGGEQQRVALARALVTRPRLLLLDEPLSAVDAGARESLRALLGGLREHFPATVVHVTHDLQEAMVLGDRCGVLIDGRLEQIGRPADVLRRPQTEAVARFTGGRNIFRGTACRTAIGSSVRVDEAVLASSTQREGEVQVLVRPEEVRMAAPAGRAVGDNVVAGRIVAVTDLGTVTQVTVEGHLPLITLLARRELREAALGVGDEVLLSFDADAVHLF